MRRYLTVLAALTLLVGGCSGTTGAVNDSPPTGSNAPSASQEPVADTPSAEPTKTDDGTVAFGKSYTWEDGLTITVSTPKTFKPSQYAAGVKGKKHVVVTITVVNKTGKAYDPSLINATMQSGDTEASEIFDSEKNIEGSPDTKLLNGRQAKYQSAFSVSNPKDLVLELAPGFEYDSAIWTNAS